MRYIEVVGDWCSSGTICAWRHELLDGEPVAGYTELRFRDAEGTWTKEVLNIGKFTRENVAKWLDKSSYTPETSDVIDFHAVFDDIDIPWATEEGRETYRRVMELAAAKRR